MGVGNDTDPRLREQSMGELFTDLSNDLSTLVRQELHLAQAEMTEKAKQAGRGAGMFGGAGLMGLLALATLTTTLIAALSEGMDVWVAALIVTVIYAAGAAVLALSGKRHVTEATPPTPEQTVETLKEDAQWAKTQLPSGNK
ncbi:MAG TPA: phage holin family protein [Solirubrobacteraceae bacterium]|nr:phage holin family protein [Solirubrobacteraceae bacterium]